MRTTIAAFLLGLVLLGSVQAESKTCRNKSCKLKCNSKSSTTLFSTGTYIVDLRKGPIWINFNPRYSGYYEIKIYKKNIAVSLTECGKGGYVATVFKKNCDSISLTSRLCKTSTYRLFLNRGKRSDTSAIIQISRKNLNCSRVIRVSQNNYSEKPFYRNRYSSIKNRSCNKTSINRYSKSTQYKRKNCLNFGKIGFRISLSF